jgi:hypothetical protein
MKEEHGLFGRNGSFRRFSAGMLNFVVQTPRQIEYECMTWCFHGKFQFSKKRAIPETEITSFKLVLHFSREIVAVSICGIGSDGYISKSPFNLKTMEGPDPILSNCPNCERGWK